MLWSLSCSVAFLVLEIREFVDMIARGATPQQRFPSAFFTLGVAMAARYRRTDLAVMMAQLAIKGIRATVNADLCFALFCMRSTSSGFGSSSSGLMEFVHDFTRLIAHLETDQY